jgi:ferredoxin--NADP+ reductase
MNHEPLTANQSMFKIINKQVLTDQVKRIDITAPNIARRIMPGQFVSVSPEEDDEHIPLTVTGYDPVKGAISLIFQEVGHTTQKLGAMHISEEIFSVLGPLGRSANIEKEGLVVCITTGIGAAQILPICRAFRDKGNKIIGIIGAKTKGALMLEPQMRLACDKIYIATNDGSYERRGQATDVLEEILEKNKIDCVYAIGSVEMMRTVCRMTKKIKIKTLVKLNPVMADCMGMCGSCRVRVDGKMVLACIEGPEFDGHAVDFEDLEMRMNAYEESAQWSHHPSEHKARNGEPKILTRFLSGFIKS